MDNAGGGPRVLPEEVKRQKREAEIDDTLLRATMLPMFAEEPTRWVLLDFDGVEFEPDWRAAPRRDRRLAQAPAARTSSPTPRCWYQATGGAADPSKPDLGGAEVRMRLGFVLSRPLTHDQLEAWLGGVPGLDPCTLRTNQEIYVGRPVFEGGLADPMPVRSGVLEGLEDVVPVPDTLPEPAAREWRPGEVGADELGTEGLGLLDCPAFEAALDGIDGAAGSVRDGLGRAAWIYAMQVGRRPRSTWRPWPRGSPRSAGATARRSEVEGYRPRAAGPPQAAAGRRPQGRGGAAGGGRGGNLRLHVGAARSRRRSAPEPTRTAPETGAARLRPGRAGPGRGPGPAARGHRGRHRGGRRAAARCGAS